MDARAEAELRRGVLQLVALALLERPRYGYELVRLLGEAGFETVLRLGDAADLARGLIHTCATVARFSPTTGTVGGRIAATTKPASRSSADRRRAASGSPTRTCWRRSTRVSATR